MEPKNAMIKLTWTSLSRFLAYLIPSFPFLQLFWLQSFLISSVWFLTFLFPHSLPFLIPSFPDSWTSDLSKIMCFVLLFEKILKTRTRSLTKRGVWFLGTCPWWTKWLEILHSEGFCGLLLSFGQVKVMETRTGLASVEVTWPWLDQKLNKAWVSKIL